MPGSPTSSRVAARREPAELASHWAAAGRKADALLASVEAARRRRPIFGLAEALGHLEHALELWDVVPDASELVQIDLAELSMWAAELASQTGAAPRAVELARRAIELVETGDAVRSARLHDRLGRYLHESGRTRRPSAVRAGGRARPRRAAVRRARVSARGTRGGLMLAWRIRRVALGLRAGARARTRLSARERRSSERSRDVGRDLAYVGRSGEGLASFVRRSARRGDRPCRRTCYRRTALSPTC